MISVMVFPVYHVLLLITCWMLVCACCNGHFNKFSQFILLVRFIDCSIMNDWLSNIDFYPFCVDLLSVAL